MTIFNVLETVFYLIVPKGAGITYTLTYPNVYLDVRSNQHL